MARGVRELVHSDFQFYALWRDREFSSEGGYQHGRCFKAVCYLLAPDRVISLEVVVEPDLDCEAYVVLFLADASEEVSVMRPAHRRFCKK